MTEDTFSFAAHAEEFEEHIEASIPGYRSLQDRIASLSRNFVQDRTNIIDVGCSAGSLLAKVRDANQVRRPAANYVGVDHEENFQKHWNALEKDNLHYVVANALDFSEFRNVSFATSVFTVQFLPEPEKMLVLEKIYDGLRPGGGFIIAEKILASSARLQEALTFNYYDEKLKRFSPEEILNKERQLRGQMTSWTFVELLGNLRTVGFQEMEVIWDTAPFTAVLAIKTGQTSASNRSLGGPNFPGRGRANGRRPQ